MNSFFQNMPDHARVWIYMADRVFSEQEQARINASANDFIQSWTSHGAKMQAELAVLHNRFIVLMVDESAAGASGCGIDKSVHFIKQLEAEFTVDLFNRMLVGYQTESGQIEIVHFNHLDNLVGLPSVKIFNNAISTKKEFDSEWLLPIYKSWVSAHVLQK